MINRTLLALLFTSLIFFNCGSPNDPEVFSEGDGGYKIVGRLTTAGYAQDVVAEDTVAYVAQGEGGIFIVNISDPSNPVKIFQLIDQLKGYSYKIAKKDSAVYIAAGNFGLSTVNVANPLNPFVTFTNQGPRPVRDVEVFGEYLLTASSELGVGIAKITVPPYPDFRGSMIINGYARGLCTSPDSSYLFIASGELGLTILDVSDMQNGFGIYPIVGWLDTDGYANDLDCHPDLPYLFAACGTAGLAVIDYSDTADLKIAASFNTGGYAKEVFYKNNKLYVSTENRGLQIFDVSDVKKPVRIGTVKTSYAMGFCVTERYIYLADEKEGLLVISIPL